MPEHWTTLRHNGVAFPLEYQPQNLHLRAAGKVIDLSPLAEEMAYHLAKKKDTVYMKDPVFLASFTRDFKKQLPEWAQSLSFEDFDFGEFYRLVDEEKKRKESITKARKKAEAATRKANREQMKATYGHAEIDGERVEIANWLVEPPGLFMGRGAHPMRGRWKPRVFHADVILNLDKEAQIPPGQWKQIVHDQKSMWLAKWIDKLGGREKYVWLHDSSGLQQERNKEKYDRATRIGRSLDRISARIVKGMSSRDPRVRKIATVCYLIDKLGMRVGDEKDEDEADTVGATTLRVEHVKLEPERIEFDFLGKDYVRWVKSLSAPNPVLVKNIREFILRKKPTSEIFEGVNSGMVNRFLSEIQEGLTAKVFRTYHATAVVENYLRSVDSSGAEEFEKLYQAKISNLVAAEWCNHKRTPAKNWEELIAKKKQRLEQLRQMGKKAVPRMRKLELQLDLAVKTKDYNLNTALKNYIDPRVYKSWCDHVGIDWTSLYTKAMQRKFAWVSRSKKPWTEEIQPVPISS
jgi:DNA topoisomerase-1